MIAGVTVLAEKLRTANAVYTRITAAAYIVVCTVCAFFFTALTYGGAFGAAVSTVADALNAV